MNKDENRNNLKQLIEDCNGCLLFTCNDGFEVVESIFNMSEAQILVIIEHFKHKLLHKNYHKEVENESNKS